MEVKKRPLTRSSFEKLFARRMQADLEGEPIKTPRETRETRRKREEFSRFAGNSADARLNLLVVLLARCDLQSSVSRVPSNQAIDSARQVGQITRTKYAHLCKSLIIRVTRSGMFNVYNYYEIKF